MFAMLPEEEPALEYSSLNFELHDLTKALAGFVGQVGITLGGQQQPNDPGEVFSFSGQTQKKNLIMAARSTTSKEHFLRVVFRPNKNHELSGISQFQESEEGEVSVFEGEYKGLLSPSWHIGLKGSTQKSPQGEQSSVNGWFNCKMTKNLQGGLEATYMGGGIIFGGGIRYEMPEPVHYKITNERQTLGLPPFVKKSVISVVASLQPNFELCFSRNVSSTLTLVSSFTVTQKPQGQQMVLTPLWTIGYNYASQVGLVRASLTNLKSLSMSVTRQFDRFVTVVLNTAVNFPKSAYKGSLGVTLSVDGLFGK